MTFTTTNPTSGDASRCSLDDVNNLVIDENVNLDVESCVDDDVYPRTLDSDSADVSIGTLSYHHRSVSDEGFGTIEEEEEIDQSTNQSYHSLMAAQSEEDDVGYNDGEQSEDRAGRNDNENIADDDDDDDNNNDDVNSTGAGTTATNLALLGRHGETVAIISWLRVIVCSFMIFASALTSSIVYSTIRASQHREYKQVYEDARNAIVVQFNTFIPTMLLPAIDNLVMDYVSYEEAATGKLEWPFITLPGFAKRASNYMALTGAETIMLMPVVSSTEKHRWEEYSLKHYSEWLNTTTSPQAKTAPLDEASFINKGSPLLSNDFSMEKNSRNLRQRQLQLNNSNIVHEYFEIHPFIFDYNSNEMVNGSGPFTPMWQMYPPIKDLINVDSLSIPNISIVLQNVLEEKKASFGPFVSRLSGFHMERRSDIELAPSKGDSSDEPLSSLHYPIRSGNTSELGESNSAEIVGIVSTMWSWKSFFANHCIIPPRSKGLILVVQSDCRNNGLSHQHHHLEENVAPGIDSLTYHISGNDVTFLGQGILHIPEFDISDWNHNSTSDNDGSQPYVIQSEDDNLDKLGGLCSYSLSIYPSKEMYMAYITNQPIYYTIVVMLLFVIASILFTTYDWFMHRRQKAILDHAVRTNDILTSLFPETVLGRLFFGSTLEAEMSQPNNNNNLTENRNSITNCYFHTIGNSANIQSSGKFDIENDIIYNEWNDSSINYEYDQPHDAVNCPSPSRSLHDATDILVKRSSTVSKGGTGNTGNMRSIPRDGTNGRPIADLFPHCTVLFADIAGFTAWSSLRDPSQVFILLESVYHAFDRIARRRGVFKVETIGDSYVAVTGCPNRQDDDHALIMARFARDCRVKFKDVTRQLELSLGPDTSDLLMRFGLNSGPVTAGVLRGEKSRFQLFGDTVNTAARMESTGERDKIQVSQSTADLLMEHGKGHWIRPRMELVYAKGKGHLQTYWLESNQSKRTSISSMSSEESAGLASMMVPYDSRSSDSLAPSNLKKTGSSQNILELNNGSLSSVSKCLIWGETSEFWADEMMYRNKHQRLIDYNVDLLASLLKQVVARRMCVASGRRSSGLGGKVCSLSNLSSMSQSRKNTDWSCGDDPVSFIDEVQEVIRLPNFNAKAFKEIIDPKSIELAEDVHMQLHKYVSVIASLYRRNPFHNFEHASHVTMSLNKLLQRVVTPSRTSEITAQASPHTGRRRSLVNRSASIVSDDSTSSSSTIKQRQIASELHNYTYGITSDPLTQFAVVFGALIHDCDHRGVSNAQLIKENVDIASKFNNKSILEQNSIDLAWNLLMDESEYGALQECIFPTEGEYRRFRQVVVNVVMATDIYDNELNDLRNNRWNKAFNVDKSVDDIDDEHRKATIVIEHLMQASDVAHTMQHWHVYQKWNRRLFDELYTAYRSGRMESDPSRWWYLGELKFFDGYIIPLAKKLKDCNVFGVASDECLVYAQNNKKEWESKGEQIVNELIANFLQREAEENQVSQAVGQKIEKHRRFARRRSLMTTGG